MYQNIIQDNQRKIQEKEVICRDWLEVVNICKSRNEPNRAARYQFFSHNQWRRRLRQYLTLYQTLSERGLDIETGCDSAEIAPDLFPTDA